MPTFIWSNLAESCHHRKASREITRNNAPPNGEDRLTACFLLAVVLSAASHAGANRPQAACSAYIVIACAVRSRMSRRAPVSMVTTLPSSALVLGDETELGRPTFVEGLRFCCCAYYFFTRPWLSQTGQLPALKRRLYQKLYSWLNITYSLSHLAVTPKFVLDFQSQLRLSSPCFETVQYIWNLKQNCYVAMTDLYSH